MPLSQSPLGSLFEMNIPPQTTVVFFISLIYNTNSLKFRPSEDLSFILAISRKIPLFPYFVIPM